MIPVPGWVADLFLIAGLAINGLSLYRAARHGRTAPLWVYQLSVGLTLINLGVAMLRHGW